MVSINTIYAMNSGFTATILYAGTNYREHVGRSERVTEGNLDVRKREIKAEDRELH